jgi:hypothetical protein
MWRHAHFRKEERTMSDTLNRKLTSALIALALAFSLGAATPLAMHAQDDVATEVADVGDDVADESTAVVEDDDGGFEWGLLGLLGLLGLAGFMKKNDDTVRTVERPAEPIR